jgi:ethanolamine utilization cobalamin adenosyltransferase
VVVRPHVRVLQVNSSSFIVCENTTKISFQEIYTPKGGFKQSLVQIKEQATLLIAKKFIFVSDTAIAVRAIILLPGMLLQQVRDK